MHWSLEHKARRDRLNDRMTGLKTCARHAGSDAAIISCVLSYLLGMQDDRARRKRLNDRKAGLRPGVRPQANARRLH